MKVEEYVQYDALGLAELIAKGEVTSEDLATVAHDAAEQVNDKLNAVVGFVDHRYEGELADGARFAGVPTFLKDLGAGIAGVNQEMGSRLTTGFTSPVTAHFAEQMLKAGFNIVGRTTCPEFGLTLTTESAATGRTCNPWNTDYITGGSSGGSAALVAAGVVPLAHTNDGGGSTRIPASICGNVGLKTSRGMVSLAPMNNDVTGRLIAVGCNTRTVRDSAAFLDAVVGLAPGEGTMPYQPDYSYLEKLSEAPGRYRIAVSLEDWGVGEMDATIRSEVERIAEALSGMGHTVGEATPEVVKGGAIANAFRPMWMVIAESAVKQLAPHTNRTPGPDTLEPITLEMVEEGSNVSAFEFNNSIAFSNIVSRSLGMFFGEWDLLLTPALNRPTPELGSKVSLSGGASLDEWYEEALSTVPHTPLANFSGIPAISVPCGVGPNDLPLGMHFFGPMGGEMELLDIARQLEEAEPWIDRRPEVFVS